jgi:hypothetical protein
MFDPKSQKQPKANFAGAEKSSLGTLAMVPDARPSQDTAKISARAYELYEGRGCEPGQDQQDWLRAELEILKR